MIPWAQRFNTTSKVLENWDIIFDSDIQGSTIVLHVGLNDYAERVFQEEERLALNVIDADSRKKILDFARNYRREIMLNQQDYSYTSIEQFKKNLEAIVERSKKDKVKKLYFVKIVPFPKSHEVENPGSILRSEQFNTVFDEVCRKYSFVDTIELKSIFNFHGIGKCMLPDNMHLSHFGHEVLAKEIKSKLSHEISANTKTVAIIGVGNLGSRHLQGLNDVDFDVSIELFEPNIIMREQAIQRLSTLPKNNHIKQVKFVDEIQEFSNVIDVLIIATNADVRAQVLQLTLYYSKVKHILLEKVLFQELSDYDKFLDIFDRTGINVWVNHPRRAFKFYEDFVNDIQNSKRIHYSVHGYNWNMASNALHFIDHLLYLTGKESPSFEIINGHSFVVQESKRKGFYELHGEMTAKIDEHTIVLTSEENNDSSVGFTIMINTENLKLIIDEINNTYMYAYRAKDGRWLWQHDEKNIIEYQSAMTGRVVNAIVRGEPVSLPTYKEAVLLHKPYIVFMQDVIEKELRLSFDLCPIS